MEVLLTIAKYVGGISAIITVLGFVIMLVWQQIDFIKNFHHRPSEETPAFRCIRAVTIIAMLVMLVAACIGTVTRTQIDMEKEKVSRDALYEVVKDKEITDIDIEPYLVNENHTGSAGILSIKYKENGMEKEYVCEDVSVNAYVKISEDDNWHISKGEDRVTVYRPKSAPKYYSK